MPSRGFSISTYQCRADCYLSISVSDQCAHVETVGLGRDIILADDTGVLPRRLSLAGEAALIHLQVNALPMLDIQVNDSTPCPIPGQTSRSITFTGQISRLVPSTGQLPA